MATGNSSITLITSFSWSFIVVILFIVPMFFTNGHLAGILDAISAISVEDLFHR
jgi:hypothetical protein